MIKCNNTVRIEIYSIEDFINITYKRAKKKGKLKWLIILIKSHTRHSLYPILIGIENGIKHSNNLELN
ncbi:hypothetical protein ES704_00789 [subsurface metagenome]